MEDTNKVPVEAGSTPADSQVNNFAHLSKQLVIDQVVAAIEMTKRKAQEEIDLMEKKLQEFRDKPISHFTAKFLEKVKVGFPFVLDMLDHFNPQNQQGPAPVAPEEEKPVMP